MKESFKLTIVEPAVIRRVGKLAELIELASRIEDEISFDDDSCISMNARYNTDSSYARLDDFWFPVQVVVRVTLGKKLQSVVSLSFWKREEDSRCLVMFSSNRPEDNFDGGYEEALAWTIRRVDERVHSGVMA
jgi:hypothetical protein